MEALCSQRTCCQKSSPIDQRWFRSINKTRGLWYTTILTGYRMRVPLLTRIWLFYECPIVIVFPSYECYSVTQICPKYPPSCVPPFLIDLPPPPSHSPSLLPSRSSSHPPTLSLPRFLPLSLSTPYHRLLKMTSPKVISYSTWIILLKL